MILIKVSARSFSDLVKDCIELSRKYYTTVLVMWNGSPILFEPHDSEFISDLEAYYEKQKSCNSREKFIEIINLLNSTPRLGE